MLKVTLLFEAHDPLAQARIAELEADLGLVRLSGAVNRHAQIERHER